MTNEEAKDLLDNLIGMVEDNQNNDYDEALKLGIEALEKQMPKKPKIVEVEQDTMDLETGEEYTYKIDEAHCSCCDFIIGADYDIFNKCYCENCGQRIDWENENDRTD